MREIKFRVWEQNIKQMVYPAGTIGITNENGNSWLEQFFVLGDKKILLASDGWDVEEEGKLPCIVMQYTGLKDKKGVEIYEGDILRLDDVIGNVTYSDGCFQMILDRSAGRSPILQDRMKRFEIIGNIHESKQ